MVVGNAPQSYLKPLPNVWNSLNLAYIKLVKKANDRVPWHKPWETPCPFKSGTTRSKFPSLTIDKNKAYILRWANTIYRVFHVQLLLQKPCQLTEPHLTINHSPLSPLLFIKGNIYSPERWPKLTRNICTLLATSALQKSMLPQTTTSSERKEVPASAT